MERVCSVLVKHTCRIYQSVTKDYTHIIVDLGHGDNYILYEFTSGFTRHGDPLLAVLYAHFGDQSHTRYKYVSAADAARYIASPEPRYDFDKVINKLMYDCTIISYMRDNSKYGITMHAKPHCMRMIVFELDSISVNPYTYIVWFDEYQQLTTYLRRGLYLYKMEISTHLKRDEVYMHKRDVSSRIYNGVYYRPILPTYDPIDMEYMNLSVASYDEALSIYGCLSDLLGHTRNVCLMMRSNAQLEAYIDVHRPKSAADIRALFDLTPREENYAASIARLKHAESHMTTLLPSALVGIVMGYIYHPTSK
jgi:hypothetical protein